MDRKRGLCHNILNWADNIQEMSRSGVLFSVVTELICLRSEELDNVPHCFPKHGVELWKKFYFQFISDREAGCLSSKCVNVFTNTLQEKLLKMGSVPHGKKVRKWYKDIKMKKFF